MKVRGMRLGIRLTVLCWGALALLAPVALTACTSSPSTTAPTVYFSPSVTVSASGSVSVSASAGNSGNTPSAGSGTATSGTPGPRPPRHRRRRRP